MDTERIYPLILGGGFGVRTQNVIEGPKALITTSDGKSLLEHLLFDLQESKFESAAIVSNGKFHGHFSNHLKDLQEKGLNLQVNLINDGAYDPEKRLGALGDILFAINTGELKDRQGSLLILSSDYAYWQAFKIADFVDFAQKPENQDCLLTIVRDTRDRAEIKGRFGCPEVDENGLVTSFEEKPENPKTTLAVLAFYFFRPEHIKLLKKYQNEGGKMDSPSFIIPYLLENKAKVRVFVVGNNVIDAGTPAEITRAQGY